MEDSTVIFIIGLLCMAQLGALTVAGSLLIWDYKQRAALRDVLKKQAQDIASMVDIGIKSNAAIRHDVQALGDKVAAMAMRK